MFLANKFYLKVPHLENINMFALVSENIKFFFAQELPFWKLQKCRNDLEFFFYTRKKMF